MSFCCICFLIVVYIVNILFDNSLSGYLNLFNLVLCIQELTSSLGDGGCLVDSVTKCGRNLLLHSLSPELSEEIEESVKEMRLSYQTLCSDLNASVKVHESHLSRRIHLESIVGELQQSVNSLEIDLHNSLKPEMELSKCKARIKRLETLLLTSRDVRLKLQETSADAEVKSTADEDYGLLSQTFTQLNDRLDALEDQAQVPTLTGHFHFDLDYM